MTSSIKKYYTSDLHFYLTENNKETKDYNQSIIDTINTVVRKSDKLYILGDLAITSTNTIKSLIKYFEQIKCKNIYVIKGENDDWQMLETLKTIGFIVNWDSFRIIRDSAFSSIFHLALSHFPLIDYHGSNSPSMLLHGHSHTQLLNCPPDLFNVSWSIHQKPMTIEELLSIKYGHHSNPYLGMLDYHKLYTNELTKLNEAIDLRR